MSAEGLVLVDTSVFVYALTQGPDPRHEKARKSLEVLFHSDRLCTSTQVLQEIYVTLTRKYAVPVEEAIRDIEDLSAYPVFQADRGAFVDAARLAAEEKLSFWDGLIVVAGLRMGAEVLLTEDLNSGQTIRGMRVASPFDGSTF